MLMNLRIPAPRNSPGMLKAIGRGWVVGWLALGWLASVSADSPNVLILYADDMGYGDLHVQNTNSRIPTPHLDALALSGMRFTDGHSSSGICTPSRYALLTGRHHFRKFHGIVNALGPSVLDPDRLTMPEMFQQCGYKTACIGKWHLGWDWQALKQANAQPIRSEGRKQPVWPHDAFDWTRTIPDGPLAHGFDSYFGDAVINFPPYCWIENDRVTRIPNHTLTGVVETAKEGQWEARPGPAVDDWDFYQVLPTLTEAAESSTSAVGNSSSNPFSCILPSHRRTHRSCRKIPSTVNPELVPMATLSIKRTTVVGDCWTPCGKAVWTKPPS